MRGEVYTASNIWSVGVWFVIPCNGVSVSEEMLRPSSGHDARYRKLFKPLEQRTSMHGVVT